MTSGRLHLLSQAALCFQEAGQFAEAGRCADLAGEPLAAAESYRTAGDLASAAGCYQRAGQTGEAAACLLSLGRTEDVVELWQEAGSALEAGWVLAAYAREPLQARAMLAAARAGGAGDGLRLRIALALCAALERRPGELAKLLAVVEDELTRLRPAGDRGAVLSWAVLAADEIRRPDLAARVFSAAYLGRVPGAARQWQEWARQTLGGTAGTPDRDLLCHRGARRSPSRRPPTRSLPSRLPPAGFALPGSTRPPRRPLRLPSRPSRPLGTCSPPVSRTPPRPCR